VTYLALAADYDGTIAEEGHVPEAVLAALERLRQSGRRAILVTGRKGQDLRRIFPGHRVFDRLVFENGGVVHDPGTGTERVLGAPPPETLLARLRREKVEPLSVGRVIVATEERHRDIVLGAVRDLGLTYQPICNKGALMLLPPGVDKATGLAEALSELRISLRQTVAVGDAENDAALLSSCGLGVAVDNAVPALKQVAGWITRGASGEGVVELIERLLAGEARPHEA